MTETRSLPDWIRQCLDRFEEEGWRERKRAVEELLHGLSREQPSAQVIETLIQTLLDSLLDDNAVHARSACVEVLNKLGRAAVPMILTRIQAGGERTHLLVDLLGTLGTESELDLLCSLASDAEATENVRASAASALGRLGGERAMAVLEEMLSEPSEMLRLYALDALRTVGARVHPSGIAGLLDSPVTRRATTDLLGLSNSSDALPMLVPLLKDGMQGVRAATVLALARLQQDFTAAGNDTLIPNLMSGVGEEIRKRLRELVAHRDREVSTAAIELAGFTGDAEVLEPVLAKMNDPLVFERAVQLVARLGSRASAALVRLVDLPQVAGSEHLFRLVSALQPESVDPKLIDPLLAALEGPDGALAVIACDALRQVGGRSAMAPLYRCCGDEGELGEHAAEALAAVAHRVGGGRYDDLRLIIGGAWPQQGGLARNLCRVVGRLGLVEFVPPLVSMLGSTDVGVRVAAAHALGQIQGDHEGVGALSFALADEEPQVRAAACRSLGQLRAPTSVQPLLSATADPNPFVRAAAVAALVLIDNPIAVARMREVVMEDPSPTVVVHAIAGLGTSGMNQDLTLLMSLCTSTDHEVVKAAARALTSYEAHRATAALLGLLSHERWDVRWAAAEVLAERGDRTAEGPLRSAREVEADTLVRQVLDQAIERLARAGETEPQR